MSEVILYGNEARLAYFIRRYSILANPLEKCRHCNRYFSKGELLSHRRDI